MSDDPLGAVPVEPQVDRTYGHRVVELEAELLTLRHQLAEVRQKAPIGAVPVPDFYKAWQTAEAELLTLRAERDAHIATHLRHVSIIVEANAKADALAAQLADVLHERDEREALILRVCEGRDVWRHRCEDLEVQLAEVRALLAEMDQEAAGAFPEYEGTGVARYAARLWRIIEPKQG